MTLLAIDGGASAAKWRLQDSDGAVLAEGRTGPLHGHLFDDTARATARSTLRDLADAIGAAHGVDGLVAGITGLSAGSDTGDWYHGVLASQFGLDRDAVVVADDLWLVCLGLLTPGKGMLIYAGTGSIGYHLTRDCRPLRCGGHGYLVDDAGGGFWIGAQALKWWLRARDAGPVPDTPLALALARRFGSTDWSPVRAAIYGGGRSFVADLTREVLGAARDGDAAAADILCRAGGELAALANRLLRASRADVLEVCLIGGTSACGHHITDPMRAGLAPGLTMVDAPVQGAAAICRAADIHGLHGLSILSRTGGR